ncbi:hypothetical protein MNBD_UNCLBAC01-883 [hydrothermal vent metagenome]|uniref:Response regulatory domain-containing protein n=1 Tax=hydrothermal vent metagenome TaxID=652676 RepID=A0A3B1D3B3_9ZZZZ
MSDDINWELIKVLVVDDDKTTRKTLEKFFQKIGCIGAYVNNGKEAIEIIKKYNFDLCFMDLFMPEMGGVEATQIIRDEVDAVLPIVALTSSSMKADKDKCVDIGMQDYMNKPVSMAQIKEIVATYGVRQK